MPLTIQLIGSHGAGKTLALSFAVRALKRRGLRVAVIKHSHHAIDLAGTDTARYRESRADVVVFAGRETVTFAPVAPRRAAQLVPTDVWLVEGDHRHRWGKRFAIRRPSDSRAVGRAIVAYALARLPAPRRPGRGR